MIIKFVYILAPHGLSLDGTDSTSVKIGANLISLPILSDLGFSR